MSFLNYQLLGQFKLPPPHPLKLIIMLKIVYIALGTIFSILINFFSLRVRKVPEDNRTSFDIMVTPFLNWLRLASDFSILLPVDPFKKSIVRLYSLYLSFLMAIMFLIVYFTAYTCLGKLIYAVLPFISICVFSALLAGLADVVDGVITSELYELIFAYRFYASCFVAIPVSALILYICANINFTRAILVSTIGVLSYKYYIGENPGSKVKGLILAATGLIGFSMLGYTLVAGVDHLTAIDSFNHITEAARQNGTVIKPEQMFNHFSSHRSTLVNFGTAASAILNAAKPDGGH